MAALDLVCFSVLSFWSYPFCSFLSQDLSFFFSKKNYLTHTHATLSTIIIPEISSLRRPHLTFNHFSSRFFSDFNCLQSVCHSHAKLLSFIRLMIYFLKFINSIHSSFAYILPSRFSGILIVSILLPTYTK